MNKHTEKGGNNSYFGNIKEGVKSSLQGLKLSLQHIFEAKDSRKPIGVAQENYFEQETGIVTLQYPYEAIPVPDNGRYRLHNEIDDCIVCDKCAEVCPVNCIEIEAVKSTEEIRKTSDGHSVRLYAAKFDIDMAKCCFCGLCTTVCPTECLTMTKAYDFSEFDVDNMNYHFSDLSPEQGKEKQKLYEEQQAAKIAAKQAAKQESVEDISHAPAPINETSANPAPAKPVVKRPVMRPVMKKPDTSGE
jgi:NADH-quinone oxidoreductase subunit I